jgi:hypothetical protein
LAHKSKKNRNSCKKNNYLATINPKFKTIMWKSVLFLFLLIYFLLSVSGKILRFLRQFQTEIPAKNSGKDEQIKIFVSEKKWKTKTFDEGEYTEFEEVK